MAQKRSTKKREAKRSRSEKDPSPEGEGLLIPDDLPVLPAKDLVAFPNVMMSLYVGRPSSIGAVESAVQHGQGLIFVVAQQNHEIENATSKDLYRFGVVATIARCLKLSDGRMKVLMQGITRARVISFDETGNFIKARIEVSPGDQALEITAEHESIMNRVRENLQILVENEQLPEELLLVTEEIQDPGVLADVVLAHYQVETTKAQQLLEELDALKRLKFTDALITDELNQFHLSEKIRDKTRDEMAKGQKEYYLREQLKQIQRELGEPEGAAVEDLTQLKESLAKLKLPELVSQETTKQFRRLERMSPESSDYSLLRTYLEWIADLPWNVTTSDRLELKLAKRYLDDDHFGLDKAKDRILEYLSVRKLKPDSRGPILCFVGPPGVGKTSLGKSIARALGRKFTRISLGGVRDEAEIRGHRRTYVGALPGRLIQGLKQAGSRNPVFVLDELDKLGADFRGDPSAALLEVLDPQQNVDFRDHYLGVPFDLSEVLFIATANTVDTIPDALLDRLEVIYISGYTTEEKVQIAEKFLVPRQVKENGLEGARVVFESSAVQFVIERYTREAGVRNLEREIGSLCRKMARDVAEKRKIPHRVTAEVVQRLLGNTKFDPEDHETREVVGLSRGLAWTVHGGEMLPVEASVAKGTGQLQLTGQLGNVMQESARAALFYARANAQRLQLDPDFHGKLDIHVHCPGGATPKDGPSAGITIATAIVSALSQRKVSSEFAMTGEITLRGTVLAVGGVKEKALAALRYGIKKVIIPYENIKDLDEIPKEQRQKIKFIPVKHIGEVLEIALLGPRRSARAVPKGQSSERRHGVRSIKREV